MIKTASILIKKELAYLNPISKSNSLQFATEPFIKIKWSTLKVIGKFYLIKRVISESKFGLDFPKYPKEYSAFILKEFGEASFLKMVRGSRLCHIQYDDINNTYKFSPHTTINGGHEEIESGVELVSADINPEEFMEIFERVLFRCRIQ